jgi:N-sulfoglucosamine sulfohydrolase
VDIALAQRKPGRGRKSLPRWVFFAAERRILKRAPLAKIYCRLLSENGSAVLDQKFLLGSIAMNHRAGLLASVFVALATSWAVAAPPNILFITGDDLSCDSVGAFGCKLPGTTPHIDRLAAEGLRFQHAHTQVGNCMPSRNVMYSGLYPHNNRVEGFYQVRDPGYPVLADLMKAGGYFTGIRGKVSHSTPYSPYPSWDVVLDRLADGSQAHPKNVESYYRSTQQGIAAAKQAGKPFCLVINVSDPHKPFYAEGKAGATVDDPNKPSRVFTADEVPVPGFLPDHPAIREELAKYYSSVRRGDDCVGEVLRALDESGQRDRTLVMFLSDHGMPLPFAKTQLYYHSTHTPWIVRWPGVTKAGAVDKQHMISAVDLLPTLLDIAGLEHPGKLDGRSFEPLLHGQTQSGRDMIVSEYNENAGGNRHPMRAVVTRDYGYIFNPWSNGERVMATATTGTVTYRTMRELAKNNPEIARRLALFNHRVPEELYNYASDPDALENLIDNSQHQSQRKQLTESLEQWMVKTGDPMLEVFRHRDDPAVREAYMDKVVQEAKTRREPKVNKRAAAGGKRKAKAKANGLEKE